MRPAGDAGLLCIRIILFDRNDGYRPLEPQELAAALPVPDSELVWIDVTGGSVPADIADCLDLDAAALAPRSDAIPSIRWRAPWLVLRLRALNWQRERQATPVRLSLVVGANVVLTHHPTRADFICTTLDEELDLLQIGSLEAMTFAASLLDRMLTDYLDARDDFENTLDRVELEVLHRPDTRVLRDLQRLRQLASRLRQQLADHRDLFDALGRPDFHPAVSDTARESCVMLRQRYSHVVAAFENAREMVNGSFDLYTSRVSESTNDTMRLLTVVTVITGVLATVAGVLGMNFDAPVFHTGSRGFFITVVAMAAFGLGTAAFVAWRHFAGAARGGRRSRDIGTRSDLS